jgi:hypothetical protein
MTDPKTDPDGGDRARARHLRRTKALPNPPHYIMDHTTQTQILGVLATKTCAPRWRYAWRRLEDSVTKHVARPRADDPKTHAAAAACHDDATRTRQRRARDDGGNDGERKRSGT